MAISNRFPCQHCLSLGEMKRGLRSLHLIHSTAARAVDDEHDDDEEEKEDPGRRIRVHSWHRRRRRRFHHRDDDDNDEENDNKEDGYSRDSGWTLSLDGEGSSSLQLSTVADELPLPLREAAIELLLQQQILSLSPARAQESSSLLESLVLKNQIQMSDEGLLRALAGGVSKGFQLTINILFL